MRKLIWRLPGLDALATDELRRAYEEVGGHPRALEYLDALLRGGEARFRDIEQRLKKALEKKNIADPGRWFTGKKGDLDLALAEVVTLAADDVLLDALLTRLDPVPLAREQLLGTSVYRVPVDETALSWQVSKEQPAPVDPERERRQQILLQALNQVKARGEEPTPENLGMSVEDIQRVLLDRQQSRRPPLEVPEGIDAAREALEELGLLAPVQLTEDSDLHYTVHRWTADALARRSSSEALRQAHHRAARYWLWRVGTLPQSRQQNIEELLEARYHHHQAGEIDEAVEVTETMCSQLDTWGAWDREKHLCREVLTWIPERSAKAAPFLHQLGIVAQKQGAYDEALEWYRKSLAIEEELGDRAGMARSYHQLGRVAQDRGAYDEALEWYRKALAILEELGDRAGIARSYHELGIVAQMRGAYDEALEWYRKSLAIREELGDRAGMAHSYHQLGMVAQKQGAYDEALEWYRKALAILEELGDRAGMAISYGQLAALLTERGAPEEGLPLNLSSLAIHLELKSPNAGFNLQLLTHQRELLGEERFLSTLHEQFDEDDVQTVLGFLKKFTSEK
jgi:tetratricopeptide (TPR) repeat protein